MTEEPEPVDLCSNGLHLMTPQNSYQRKDRKGARCRRCELDRGLIRRAPPE